MTSFGGWEMPLYYTGVLEEHRACREHGVVFDVSHLGSVVVEGHRALDAMQDLFTNDLGRIAPGRAQYTHLLAEREAYVVDDVIVWWLDTQRFLVISNASNTGPVVAALHEVVGLLRGVSNISIEDVTATRALLAVQGPEARTLLAKVAPAAAGVRHFRVGEFTFEGVDCLVGGTGYTGEDGVELFVPTEVAPAMFEALLATGLTPAGLGARDTLRLEMGYPLHGNELKPGVTPFQASLGWVVNWKKPTFRGRFALGMERGDVPFRHITGILMDGRQAPRTRCAVHLRGTPEDELGGVIVGEVTSGNFSPTLKRGIALAFVLHDIDDGTEVTVDIRGRAVTGVLVKPPFLRN